MVELEVKRSKQVRDAAKRLVKNENAVLLLVLIGLIGVMSVVTKGLSTARVNMGNVLIQSAVRGTASVGQAFVILTSGIDVSIGGIGLFCSLLGASLMSSQEGRNIFGEPVSAFIGIAVMLLVGMGWGSINGSLVSRVGVPALVVTLGMWEVLKGASFQLAGGMSISMLPDNFAYIGRGYIFGVPIVVIVFIVVAAVGYFILNHTTFGKCVYAAGGNPVTAWLSGIKVRNTQLLVYIISGFLGGLSAVLMTARIMSASSTSLANLEIDSISAVAVGGVSLSGGRGNLIGVVIGVLIIGVINNAMNILGAMQDTQGIVKGAILIIAVVIDTVRRRN